MCVCVCVRECGGGWCAGHVTYLKSCVCVFVSHEYHRRPTQLMNIIELLGAWYMCTAAKHPVDEFRQGTGLYLTIICITLWILCFLHFVDLCMQPLEMLKQNEMITQVVLESTLTFTSPPMESLRELTYRSISWRNQGLSIRWELPSIQALSLSFNLKPIDQWGTENTIILLLWYYYSVGRREELSHLLPYVGGAREGEACQASSHAWPSCLQLPNQGKKLYILG